MLVKKMSSNASHDGKYSKVIFKIKEQNALKNKAKRERDNFVNKQKNKQTHV